MTIKDKATKWWSEQITKDIYIVSSTEIPDQRQREFLKKEKYIYPLTKGNWLLKKPEDQIKDVFPLLYWQVIEKIFSKSGNWSIWGNPLSFFIVENKPLKNIFQ